jgi:signal transduction histidine kinase
MTRRFWPAALTAVSIVVLGSYLVYTQYIVRQIEREAAVHKQIIALVQQGMLQIGLEGAAETTLMDLQQQLQGLNVPIVFFNAAGEPQSANNLPFPHDPATLSTPEGQKRVREYAARLAATRPANVISQPGVGMFYFGDPPILGWLRWIPALQVGAGVLLILIAFVVMRADMRAHREQLWSAMARELAHQMGTPLSSLSGWVEVLQLADAERESMASAERIGRLMQTDVERLERVSRRFELVGKGQPLQLARIQSVVDEIVCYFQPRLPHLGKGITLRKRIEPDLPPVLANQVLLVWALENIVKNAVDALAGRGGRISIVAVSGEQRRFRAGKAGTVHVLIADNGPGIALSVRERIFEPGVTTKASGWGVGLSLSRRIVEELHHGRITVHNRASGGTVFDVALPGSRRTHEG